MKTINKIILFALTLVFFNACEQNYIDEINAVSPGADETAPTVEVTYPIEGAFIKLQNGKDWNINMDVRDDIEIQTISVLIDGSEVGTVAFKDYRHYSLPYAYNDITDGTHTLQVVATDLSGKSTSSDIINFEFLWIEKFIPLIDEIFYMNFENNVKDFASYEDGEIIGTPSFGTGVVGDASYQGADDSYINFSPAILPDPSAISMAFWYNNDETLERCGLVTADFSGNGDSRNSGFRLFKEGNDKVKMNIGFGTADSWYADNTASTLPVTTDGWNHIAFTITSTKFIMYFDGNKVYDADFTGPMSLELCDYFAIGSGGPGFAYWGHAADRAMYDDFYIFDRELTAEDLTTLMAQRN